ncbi:glycosyltransferase [Sabulilitoribacter multivorans]|uniref:Glycosyltransferase n=1 Tax=Flaviramulus multivorans TaxID=1304750 RepID=A0ABS9IGZ2_9FLAO|nr:glycosyltransferase [Flaviramulus multivorans]MCF7560038.1 glycosyltransferase [Flaviramulus multivorans]
MKLSIIVPCYNVEDHIIRCLNSLVNQNLNPSDFEIIVIDDGSSDTSISLVKEFISKHKNIILYTQENRGLGAVRNRGIKLAKGEYIYFIDSDDYLAYNTMNIILESAINNDVEILGFQTILTDDLSLFKSETVNEFNETSVSTGVEYMLKSKLHRSEAWWYILKREFLIDTGHTFEEGKFMEDIVFTFRILTDAKRFLFLPIDAHRYVKNPDSIMNNESQKHLTKLIEGYISMIFRLHALAEEFKSKKQNDIQKVIHKIKYTSNLNTFFMFFKIIRSNISIKNINIILNKLKKIGAYPYNRRQVTEEYSHIKIKVIAFIFNNKFVFYTLLYPLRVLYKMKLIKLP